MTDQPYRRHQGWIVVELEGLVDQLRRGILRPDADAVAKALDAVGRLRVELERVQTSRRVETPGAPAGHEWHVEMPRSDQEIFDLANTCEDLEHARARLGPRLRCACGRAFGSRAGLDDHLKDPLRDERDRSYR